jgi:hypothetical protein
MRIQVSMVVAAALASMAAAQSEGFEPGPATPGVGPLPAGWTSVNNSLAGPGTVPNWQVRNDTAVFPANTGASFAWANYNAVPGANDISLYLMSPQVTIANGASISFWTRTVNTPAFPDRLSLVFNTTGSTLPADFTNVLLTVNPTLTTTGYPSTWTQYSATISGVSGSVTGRYAFHYNPTNGGPAGNNSDFIGIDDVLFTPAGSGNVLASNTTLGQGCIQQYASLYELFATSASFDLSNTGISFLATGSGYLVLPGLTAYVPPSATATALTLGDDAETSVALSGAFPFQGGTTTSLFVCSNGFVSVGSGNGTAYVPAGPGFLNAPQATWRHWHDYNPAAAGSGAVKFEEVGGIAYITWDGVYDFGGTGPASANTFQFQFDQATGNVHIVFQTISTGGNGRLVGYSPGGASADPGSTDLSAALPATVSLQQNDILPLALAATTRPITGANWDLSVNNVPATGVLGVDVFGLSDPGINDLFFLGAPGCGLRAALDVTNGWLVSGATHTYSLPVPNNPALLNLNLFTTSAVFQVPQVNALGAITANGIRGVVGNF